ncbi:hypothetical protein DCC81_24665 [Chitinophaga parva]|uniref:Uncharacterized protein n=1 Tax=Chitinophaga parva TaxID=2169414 RepID=A0A2T7BBL0_9BACT|nr:hypothetical protein [Chitinophaga parva]PUZ21784.1 hypothetical protein DCC81_24665 [Chitinophaga parva]
MGLKKNEHKTYVSINGNGKIAQRVTENTPGAVSRTLESGKVIHQMEYDYIEGRITGMNFYEHKEFGNFLNVIIDDEFVLQLKSSSRYFYSFCYALPNIDLTKDVRLNPWRKQDGDKVKQALYVNQGGKESVAWYFTRDNPNGLPDMVKIKVKGKETWDDSARLEWMENYIKDNILPKLGAAVSVSGPDDEGDADDQGGEDLPF